MNTEVNDQPKRHEWDLKIRRVPPESRWLNELSGQKPWAVLILVEPRNGYLAAKGFDHRPTASDVLSVLSGIIAGVRNANYGPVIVRIDHHVELSTSEFEQALAQMGIIHEQSDPPAGVSVFGKVERRDQGR